MANKKFLLGMLVMMLVFGMTAAGCYMGDVDVEEDGGNLSGLVGVWEGSYGTSQGEHGMKLDVYEEKGKYKALFSFYNLPGRTNAKEGSYRMNVSYTSGEYHLRYEQWIQQPSGYVSLDFKGKIKGAVFSGTSDYSSGSGYSGRVGSFSTAKKE